MFGISGEHILILGVVLLIFGPRRLPELGHTLGKAFRNFKDSVSGVEEAKFRHLGDLKPESQKQSPDPLQGTKTEVKKPDAEGGAPGNVG